MTGRVAALSPTLALEDQLFANGADVVVGFDEVGRGALAGPVMVGAAAIRRHHSAAMPVGLADSKLLTEKKREAMFEPLQQWVAAWGVGAASNHEIDEWGISRALGVAALRALQTVEHSLLNSAQNASVDGAATAVESSIAISGILDGPNDYISKTVVTFEAPAISILPAITTQVKADQTCASVSAASVLAKVTRDRIMEDLGRKPRYALYGWEKNKGYGSKVHREAIRLTGPSDLHRISWHLV